MPTRLVYLTATMAIIGLGLASRNFPGLLPSSLGKYPGDALWTLMMLTALGVIRPAWRIRRLAGSALLISYAVEFSQLYHAPWIDAVRATTLGHLVLGSAFSWRDLLAYTVGAGMGMLAGALLPQHRRLHGARGGK
jgi:hypothetical protein